MAKRKHPFSKIERGHYRAGRYSIIKYRARSDGAIGWLLIEEFDWGANSIMHDGETKSECIKAFDFIRRSGGLL